MATPGQIEEGRRRAPLPLADALVQMGVITPTQRDTVEKKLEARPGGVSELGGNKLLRKIGEGGMGAVYLAEDTLRKRKVALKILPKKHASNADFLKRFRREAEAATKLDHPNIVQAYSAGEDRGYHFYVMEYCEGESLRKRIERLKHLPAADACGIVLQVARGLQHAHEQGFIHRDVKPENLIVTPAGVVKILDLGLAKNIEDTDASFRTVTGAALGTPHYISPEQARGDKSVDGRTDIYSLGATFYHLITGQVPFQGSSIFEIIQKHLMEQLADPRDVRPEIPEAFVQVVRKMMAKAPDDRHRNCRELIQDLDRLGANLPPTTAPLDAALSSIALPRGGVAAPAPRRHGLILGSAAAAILIASILAYAAWPSPASPEPEPSKPPPQVPKAAPKPEPPKPEPVKPGPVPDKKPEWKVGVDLLARLKPDMLDRGRGSWTLSDGALVSPGTGSNSSPSLIHLPCVLQEEYDLYIDAQRIGGSQDIVFGLSSGAREFAMAVDGWGGSRSGLNREGGRFAWQAGGPGRQFADGKAHAIRFEVRKPGATLFVDDTPIVTLSDYSGSSIPAPSLTEGRPEMRCLSIATVNSSYRITRVFLAPARNNRPQ